MAEQSSYSASSTICDDMVTLPKAQYTQAVAKIKQQQLQLVAANNLHGLIRNKEEELIASKEENQHLRLTLEQTETRLNNVIRLQASAAASVIPAATHGLEADDAVRTVPFSDRTVSLSDVEVDGEVQSCEYYGDISKPTEKTFGISDSSGTFKTRTVMCPSVTASSDSTSSASASVCSAPVTCLSSSVTVQTLPVSSAASTECKDLLDKVLQQNARLKKTLRDLLNQRGLSVSTYLVCYIGADFL